MIARVKNRNIAWLANWYILSNEGPNSFGSFPSCCGSKLSCTPSLHRKQMSPVHINNAPQTENNNNKMLVYMNIYIPWLTFITTIKIQLQISQIRCTLSHIGPNSPSRIRCVGDVLSVHCCQICYSPRRFFPVKGFTVTNTEKSKTPAMFLEEEKQLNTSGRVQREREWREKDRQKQVRRETATARDQNILPPTVTSNRPIMLLCPLATDPPRNQLQKNNVSK